MPMEEFAWLEFLLCMLQSASWLFPRIFEYITRVYGSILANFVLECCIVFLNLMIIELVVFYFKRFLRAIINLFIVILHE